MLRATHHVLGLSVHGLPCVPMAAVFPFIGRVAVLAAYEHHVTVALVARVARPSTRMSPYIYAHDCVLM